MRQHETCHHRSYKLTCADYERLVVRANNLCELCGRPGEPKLHLDHDHELGDMAVRGLVCNGCNAIMAYVDSGRRAVDQRVAAYLERAFFLSLPTFRVLRGPTYDAAVEATSPRTQRALARYVNERNG